MRKCRKCKADKADDQFPEWAGKPGLVCTGCKVPTGGAAAGNKKKPKALVTVADTCELTLEFPAGFGFAANTREDVIQIDQWPADGTGEAVSIVLSRAEFATIAAHFGPWAERRVDG